MARAGAGPAAPMREDFEEYRPVKGRKKLLVVLLAVTTAIGVLLLMIYRVGSPELPRHIPSGPQRCAGQQTADCIGGKVEVIVPAAAGSAGG